MSRLALYVFGPPRLELDEAPVHIPYRKAIALFAYLAVTGQPHTRDSLAALLWPENDQRTARAELRRILSAINRTLGSGWFSADREMVCLNTQPDPAGGMSFGLDVAVFQGKLKICESHNHPPTVTCPDCTPALEEAVETYSADFMAGFSLKDCPAYDEWQFFQAEELRRQLTNTLVRLSSHYAGMLEYETAINHARRWISLDPLHEPAHRHLIVLYEGSGQRAAALRQYETCRQVLSEQLGVEPTEGTRVLFDRIRATTLISLPDSQPKINLPAQSTPFIGRETELAEIRVKLKQENCRLLTLLGPGGSGKTRLAIKAAEEFVDYFKHGVTFVNLAPIEEPNNIPSTIAGALNFSFSERGTPEEHLFDYLRNKKMLLVLDNFEHLLPGAKYVNQIIKDAPGVNILATSRTNLSVTGEHLYPVMGMAYPKAPGSGNIGSQQYSAVRLFESGAKRRQPAFELTDKNIHNVVRICTLVEGMPLGIVLAANWVRMLSLGEIEVEITQDLAFLETEMRDLPQRQRSLMSVFNHSWRLLCQRERGIMSALSVFRGGFTRQTAYKIAAASLGDLMGLIDKSILYRTVNGRFEIHELLRQYASEKLAFDPKVEARVHDVYSDYYFHALASWERELQGPRQGTAQKEMVLEIDNIRAVWEMGVKKTRLRSLMEGINGLCVFYMENRQLLNGEATCRSLVERLDALRASHQDNVDPCDDEDADQIDHLKLLVRALAWGGFFTGWVGNLDLSQKFIQRCLATLERRELVNQDTRFEKALILLAFAWNQNKSPDESIQLAEQAIELFESLKEPWWVGNALHVLALKTFVISPTESIKITEQSLVVHRKLGDLSGIAVTLERMSWLPASRFQFTKAEEMLQEALAIFMELEDHHNIVSTYGSLGTQWVWQGRFHEAHSLYREILATYHDFDYKQSFAALFIVRACFPDQFLGEYEAVRRQAQHSLEFLREMKHFMVTPITAVVIEILGSVALAEGSYQEAHGWFQECLPVFQTGSQLEKVAKVFACQGFVAHGLKQRFQAQGYFYQALRGAIESEYYLPLVHTMPGIALLFSDQGEIERAVELYALASTQGIVANSKWFADIAGDEIAETAAKLPAEVIETTKARGRALDLWDTAVELLNELEGLGWNSGS